MESDETDVISKWVAEMNLDLHKNHSDPSMELVWLPIKFDENGNGELIGEGGDTFSFHQLTKPQQGGNLETNERIFQPVEIRTVSQNSCHTESVMEECKVLQVEDPVIIKSANDIRICVENQSFQESPRADAIQSLEQDEVVENNNNNAENGDVEQEVAPVVQPAPVDEVAVEARENNMLGNRNWRLMLFILIVCLIAYQLMDRLLLNAWGFGGGSAEVESIEPSLNGITEMKSPV